MISVLLFVILTFFLVTNFFLSQFDILSPISILLVGYLIGVLSFILENPLWGIEFGWQPFFFIIVGILAFSIGASLFEYLFSLRMDKGDSLVSKRHIETILISNTQMLKYISVTIILLQIIVTIITYHEMQSLSGQSSISDIISSYRTATISSSSAELRIPATLLQSQKLLTAFSLSLMFYFFYFRDIHMKKVPLYFLIPILFFMLQQLLLGGRLQMIRVLFGAFVLHYFLLRIKNGWQKSDFFKIARIGVLVLVISVPAFYLLKFSLGRSSTENLTNYVLRYLGGSTGSFAIYVNQTVHQQLQFGQETFMGIYDFIGRRTDANGLITLPWATSPTGIAVGNVYGADRRYLADFGVSGIVFLNLFMGIFYGGFYGYLKKKWRNGYIAPVQTTIYIYLFYAVFFQFVEGFFFMSVISVGSIIQILMIVLVFYFIKYSANFRKN